MTPIPTDYPFTTRQILRFGDTDRQGHINNAVYSTFFESGRVALLYDESYKMPPQGKAFVLAQINISFVEEILFPGDVIIGTRVARLGNSSIGFEQSIYWNDKRCANAESVVVFIDNATRRSTPLTEAVRSHFGKFV